MLTIGQAIIILNDLDTTLPQSSPELRREAVKLGIKALIRIKACRDPEGGSPFPPLAGETEPVSLAAGTGDQIKPVEPLPPTDSLQNQGK